MQLYQKHSFASLLTAYIVTMPMANQSVAMDISNIVSSLGLERQIAHEVPGNETTATLEHATMEYSSDSLGPIDVAFRLHVKQRACTNRPCPLHGRWCVNTYNFWTTVGIKFYVGPGCSIQSPDFYKHSTSPGILTGILHEIGYKLLGGEGYLQREADNAIKNGIKNAMANNPTVRSFCGG